MPPKRILDDAPQNLKEKLSALQHANVRGRRIGGVNAINGSSLKEVDNASTNSGQTTNELSSSNIKWSSQEASSSMATAENTSFTPSLQPSRTRLAMSCFTRALAATRPPWQGRNRNEEHTKDQLALAVRKNFNALGVNEGEVIVNWLYASKNQDKEFRIRFALNGDDNESICISFATLSASFNDTQIWHDSHIYYTLQSMGIKQEFHTDNMGWERKC